MSERFSRHPELQEKLAPLNEALVSFSKDVSMSVDTLLRDMDREIEKRPERTVGNAGDILSKIILELRNDPNWRDFILLYPKLNASVQYLIVCRILFGLDRPMHDPIQLFNEAMVLSTDATLTQYYHAKTKVLDSLLESVKKVREALVALEYMNENNRNNPPILH